MIPPCEIRFQKNKFLFWLSSKNGFKPFFSTSHLQNALTFFLEKPKRILMGGNIGLSWAKDSVTKQPINLRWMVWTHYSPLEYFWVLFKLACYLGENYEIQENRLKWKTYELKSPQRIYNILFYEQIWSY